MDSNPFLGQQQILFGHVEEEHTNVLAGDPVPGRCRTRNSTEARSVANRTRTDDEECHVAHRRHGQTGDLPSVMVMLLMMVMVILQSRLLPGFQLKPLLHYY